MSEPAIRIEQLTKSFGANRVLDGVALEVPSGQTLALLGRNGAGKTTTIRIMLGLIPSDDGRVQIAGLDPAEDPLEVRRRVGYLGEDQAMYAWMTPEELWRFLAPFYPTWDAAWADDLLTRFDLPRRTRIGRLSKGQSVKLGLAAALAHRPQIVVLDDPSMGLDPIARKEFNRDLVEHLQASGCTVLYSSHLLDEVEAVADAVAILHQGRIVRAEAGDRLRDDVKQIVFPGEAAPHAPRPDGLLDARRHADRLVVTTGGADDYVGRLESDGVAHDVVDLSLDEIFEAYVIGRPEEWPDPRARLAPVTA